VTIESLMHGDPDKTTGTDEFRDRGEAGLRSDTEGSRTVAELRRNCVVPHIGVKASNTDTRREAMPASKLNSDVAQGLDHVDTVRRDCGMTTNGLRGLRIRPGAGIIKYINTRKKRIETQVIGAPH
jgi:hypothetical protein